MSSPNTIGSSFGQVEFCQKYDLSFVKENTIMISKQW